MKKLILSGILALFLVATTIMAGVEWMPNNRFIKMCHIADVNDDKIVNAFDLTKVRFNYQKNCSKENKWCNELDLNYDGLVNIQDTYFVQAWIGKSCPIALTDLWSDE